MKLLTPMQVGPRTAPNRIVFGPHETNLGAGRRLSVRHTAYYERRAAGGVGTIVTEEASVHESDWPYERSPLGEECGGGWAEIVDACRPHETLVIAALGHAGGQGSSAYSQAPMWAPSRVPEVNTREVPKWMESGDIDAVIAGFGVCAEVAVDAGCDGVELNAGQFSLIRQFLSGLTNLRDDEWGSDRSRFARGALEATRAAIGSDRVLGLRLSCDELAPWAGLVPEAAAELAAVLAEHVDYLTVVRGSIFSVDLTRPDGHTGPGFNLDLATQVRAAVRDHHGDRVPVIAQGSIVDWDQAEWAVGDGQKSDGVEMTRALLADADLPAKLDQDHADRIRPCVLCNQTCQVRDARNPIVTCVVDPRTGHELSDADPDSAAERSDERVLVIGGGPAGLEAARVAALRGSEVRLVERGDRLGGSVLTASAGGGRSRLAAIVDWLDLECRRLDVTIDLETELSEEAVASTDVDRVVVATGSTAGEREYSCTAAAVVMTAAEALDTDSLPGGPVFVWDPIGGPVGVSVAEKLVGEGRSVTLATPDNIVGNELSRSGDLAPANARLQQAGVDLQRRTILRKAKKGSVDVEDRFSGERRVIKAGVVIDAGHRLPDDQFVDVEPAVAAAHRAGDCVTPRTIHEAILEGRRVATG